MNTADMIAEFGDGECWIQPWGGRVGGETFPIKDFFIAELSGPGERSITTMKDTVEAATNFIATIQSETQFPYESARVIRCSSMLKQTIEKEVEL